MIKNNYFTCFIFFCSFTLLVCGEKNILPNLTNSQEPGDLGSLEPELLEIKQEPEPLGKKIRSRSRLKMCRLSSPEEKYKYKMYECLWFIRSPCMNNENERKC